MDMQKVTSWSHFKPEVVQDVHKWCIRVLKLILSSVVWENRVWILFLQRIFTTQYPKYIMKFNKDQRIGSLLNLSWNPWCYDLLVESRSKAAKRMKLLKLIVLITLWLSNISKLTDKNTKGHFLRFTQKANKTCKKYLLYYIKSWGMQNPITHESCSQRKLIKSEWNWCCDSGRIVPCFITFFTLMHFLKKAFHPSQFLLRLNFVASHPWARKNLREEWKILHLFRPKSVKKQQQKDLIEKRYHLRRISNAIFWVCAPTQRLRCWKSKN